MAGPRKPRSVSVDRAIVEAMVAEAVAAERARSEKAMAAVLLAIGAAAQSLEGMAEALLTTERTLELHASIIRPMADAFAAGLDLEAATEAAPDPVPN